MIGTQLIEWFARNKRDLPWRDEINPYKIWVSEIILQQTRVKQGFDYYEKFLKKFPEIFSLANASMDEVLKIWQGLGYYSRARNMHEAAGFIVKHLNGKFPDNYHDLLKIKGIGDYTASAIASIAFGEAVPVIDGNVNRVISRLFGIQSPVDAKEGKQQIRRHAEKLMEKASPALYNQAIMEFGALYCVPQHPDCENCILKTVCIACSKDIVSLLPVKSKAVSIKTRYFHYLVLNTNNFTFLQQRSTKDIWKGLYEFPMIETDSEADASILCATKQWQRWFGDSRPVIQKISPCITHILTHRVLKIRFYELADACPAFDGQPVKVKWNEVHRYAVPKVIENYLNER
ncbi:MAG: A/G-specific adenine glycosylase [Bacteroidales bacterium]|jgi:A/G-specific adenine glycosylase|nr:A/G-specific adenine glycosylase [Bacteroidales bacterium]